MSFNLTAKKGFFWSNRPYAPRTEDNGGPNQLNSKPAISREWGRRGVSAHSKPGPDLNSHLTREGEMQLS
jgi:hypothetical protein